jgi:moderate conductance mechanosensitive channel
VTWLLAQAELGEVCGEGADRDWVCAWVFEATGSEPLARLAGILETIVVVFLILLVAWLVARFLRRFVTRFAGRMEERIEERLERAQQRGAISDTQKFRGRRLQRLHAITGVLRGVVGTAVWLVAILLVIDRLGIRLQPILAGAGLIGIVIGFGAQQLVRDVLAGIAMLIEDQYGVGDWIEVDGKIGQVERVGLRSSAFRDVDGVVHHVLNGSIEHVGNLSQEWARATFDVPLALDADIPAAKALIHKIACDLAEDPVWGADIIGEPEIWGVQSFGPQGVSIRVVIPTKPLRNWDVTRQLRERLKHAFEQASMRMPSQLIEIGGQRYGYALLTHETDMGATGTGQRVTRGLVPPDVGPLDRPPEAPATTPAAETDEATDETMEVPASAAAADETRLLVQDERDVTTELRVQRGPQPRPD